MKFYLGDSVYASFDGRNVILTTENGMKHDPSNEIFLDPQVIDALELFLKNYVKEKQNGDERGKVGSEQAAMDSGSVGGNGGGG